jgi:isoleucyl-tRNA synthetase
VLDAFGTGTLADLFIVSDVEVVSGDTAAVEVLEPLGSKCGRCWKYAESVGADREHPELCGRCATVVSGVR